VKTDRSGRNRVIRVQQDRASPRLTAAMNRYRALALAVGRPTLLALAAVLLIFVLLPAALGAAAGAGR